MRSRISRHSSLLALSVGILLVLSGCVAAESARYQQKLSTTLKPLPRITQEMLPTPVPPSTVVAVPVP